jgi:hypothetical protein
MKSQKNTKKKRRVIDPMLYPLNDGDEPTKPMWMSEEQWNGRNNKYQTSDKGHPCDKPGPKVHYTDNGYKAHYYKKNKAGNIVKVTVEPDGRLAKRSDQCPHFKDAREEGVVDSDDEFSAEELRERENHYERWLARKIQEKKEEEAEAKMEKKQKDDDELVITGSKSAPKKKQAPKKTTQQSIVCFEKKDGTQVSFAAAASRAFCKPGTKGQPIVIEKKKNNNPPPLHPTNKMPPKKPGRSAHAIQLELEQAQKDYRGLADWLKTIPKTWDNVEKMEPHYNKLELLHERIDELRKELFKAQSSK